MDDRRTIAYFSMEIGLDPEMPTYSGGLGILAGDPLGDLFQVILNNPMYWLLSLPSGIVKSLIDVTLSVKKGHCNQRTLRSAAEWMYSYVLS